MSAMSDLDIQLKNLDLPYRRRREPAPLAHAVAVAVDAIQGESYGQIDINNIVASLVSGKLILTADVVTKPWDRKTYDACGNEYESADHMSRRERDTSAHEEKHPL